MTAAGAVARTRGVRGLWLALVAVGVVASVAALLGIGVRSTHGGQAAVDEPQYLLSALSLAEDGDLNIADELRADRAQPFHQATLPVQTEVLPDGRQISPHDPLLPLLLAVPMGLGGWVAAKAALAVLAGVLAALTLWVAVVRLRAPLGLAGVVVGVAAASAPLAVYGQQVYPELPAAVAVVAAVAILTGRLPRAGVIGVGVAIVALPWLSVKYAPVAAALAVLALVRLWRRGDRLPTLALAGALAGAGAVFLGLHQEIYDGWTAYASGDHFVDSGEFGVIGFDPDYGGRSSRLIGLLVDRDYGLVAWQPAWLLAVPAVGAVLRRRPAHWSTLVAPLAVGWLTASFVALTMHGYWWPGRQVVVVLPLAVLLVIGWLARGGVWIRVVAGVLGAVGILTYGWLLVDGWAERLTWVSGFQRVGAPLHALSLPLLPDYRDLSAATWTRHGLWVAVVLALLALGWWRAGRRAGRTDRGADGGSPPDPSPPTLPVCNFAHPARV